jgi:hypothetical protein
MLCPGRKAENQIQQQQKEGLDQSHQFSCRGTAGTECKVGRVQAHEVLSTAGALWTVPDVKP